MTHGFLKSFAVVLNSPVMFSSEPQAHDAGNQGSNPRYRMFSPLSPNVLVVVIHVKVD